MPPVRRSPRDPVTPVNYTAEAVLQSGITKRGSKMTKCASCKKRVYGFITPGKLCDACLKTEREGHETDM